MKCYIIASCKKQRVKIRQTNTDPVDMAVVGGGAAGLEADRVAHELGDFVNLFEKSGIIGGAILGCCLVNG